MEYDEKLMWVEKYRPQVLSDLVDQADVVERLSAIIKKPDDMPTSCSPALPGRGRPPWPTAWPDSS